MVYFDNDPQGICSRPVSIIFSIRKQRLGQELYAELLSGSNSSTLLSFIMAHQGLIQKIGAEGMGNEICHYKLSCSGAVLEFAIFDTPLPPDFTVCPSVWCLSGLKNNAGKITYMSESIYWLI